jgi:hypothetical protein
MEKHITVVGAIHIALGTLGLLGAVIVFVAVVGGGLISGDKTAITITGIVGTAIAFFILLPSLPEIIGGIGLLYHKQWARFLVMVLSVLDLFNVPVGTVLGGYSLWVLVQDETAELFAT